MFPEKLYELRKKNNLTQEGLAKKLNVSKQTVGSWERGRTEPSIDIINELSTILNTTTDYLLGKTEKKYWELNKKEEKDVGKQIEKMIDGIENEGDLNFYGEPLTDKDRELLSSALEIGLRMSKEKAKKKFTRKDYRD